MNELPIIIPSIFGTAEVEALNLPSSDRNLFGRIIRNPQPLGRPPKERECAEMLCAVLLNSEQLRNAILDWFGNAVGQSIDWDELNVSIATEQQVGGKRDDLRISGRHTDTGVQSLLWSIEVKVGAGFHQSSALEPDSAQEPVLQITNYDRWLARQDVKNRAGFVLTRLDTNANMPPGLMMSWGCLTWTQLGQAIEPLLTGDVLSGKEAFLARHLLGFIRNHFWEVIMNIDPRLDFDDIALMRAYSAIGKRTVLRADSLFEPLARVMAAADIGPGSPIVSGRVLEGLHRKVVYQSLVDPGNTKPPYVFAGLTTDRGLNVTVSLETSPRYARKQALHDMLKDRQSALKERNPDWNAISLEEKSWRDLELAVSVEYLLVAKDQVVWIEDFVSKALEDLKAAGIIEGARSIEMSSS